MTGNRREKEGACAAFRTDHHRRLDGWKEQARDWTRGEYMPFLVLGAAMLFLHYLVPGLTKDDRYYWNVLNEQDTLSYLIHSWTSWTSRLMIEAAAIWVEHLPMAVWKVLDTAVYTGTGLVLSKLIIRENRRQANQVLCALMLIYPFLHMSTAGWMTTTITYLWPLAAGLCVCLTLKRLWGGKKLHVWEYPCGIVLVLYAGSLEQMSAVMTAVTAAAWVMIWRRGRKSPLPPILFCLSAACVAAVFLCPGNGLRTGSEIRQAFADYGMLSIIDRLQIGVVSTWDQMFFSSDLLFGLLCLMLACAVFMRTEDTFFRAAAVLPFSVSLLMGPLEGIMKEMLPGLTAMEEQLGTYGAVNLINFDWKRSYLVLLIMGAAYTCLVVSFYILYGNTMRGWLLTGVFLLGSATRFVMGFSPTVWKSSDRTYLFLMFAVIICMAAVWHDFGQRWPQRWRSGWLLLLGILAVASVWNCALQMA